MEEEQHDLLSLDLANRKQAGKLEQSNYMRKSQT
jgi:hypothetical protein